ncbi:MAG: AMP-binding protein [Desulfobacterales bacterium]|nr:AMP-binding protein [Desulfobacterales bacterium]
MARPYRYTPQMYAEYKSKGYWNSETPSDLWRRNAKDYPDKEAIVDSGTRLTWQQANQWIDRLSLGFLELGFKKDDLIVLQLPNSVELCLLRVAMERAGLLCLPVLRTWRHRDLGYALKQVDAAGIVIPRQFREFDYFQMVAELRPGLPELKQVFVTGDTVPPGAVSIRKMVETPLEKKYPIDFLKKTQFPAEEFSLILPTGGTTGFPKFVENPICAVMVRDRACVTNLKLNSADVIGALSPTSGGTNARAYFGAPMIGAKIAMLEHFTPKTALAFIEKEKITVTPLVPTQLAMMIREPDFENYDLTSLRLVLTMGAPLPYELAVEVEEKLGCPIVPNYGSIDCAAACTGSLQEVSELRLRTVGKPYGGAQVRLVDEEGREISPDRVSGEIQIRGPGASSGYFRDHEATRQAWTPDGWYKTGDLGTFAVNGDLAIVGRKKEVIIRGGQNIYPVEIENLLAAHPKILHVAVVKMPDDLMGEKACAYAVAKPGESLTFDELIAFLKEQGIAPYKWPERLETLEALPLGADGQKVLKMELEKDIAAKIQSNAKGI